MVCMHAYNSWLRFVPTLLYLVQEARLRFVNNLSVEDAWVLDNVESKILVILEIGIVHASTTCLVN